MGVAPPHALKVRPLLGSTGLAVLLVGATACSPGTDPATESAAVDYAELSQNLEGLRRERVEKALACLEEQGFPGTTINPDLTTSHNLTREQDTRFDEAMMLCSAQSCPHCGEPPSTEDLTRL